jgi:septal ring factor EnvC (AmiA/AmiB activator)
MANKTKPAEPVEGAAGRARFKWKKALYGASIAISFCGSLVLLAFTFLLNDALDKTRDLVLENVAGVQKDLESLEGALATAETEVASMNATLGGLKGAFVPLENGLRRTGSSLGDFANTAAMMPFIGEAVPVAELRAASASMAESADKLNETLDTFDAHTRGIGELGAKIGEIRMTVSGQMAALAQTQTALGDVFGLVKVANFLFFIVVISMFSMLVINSAAGLL